MRAPEKTHQIYRRLKGEILSGSLSSGERMKSEPELSREYGVARVTLRGALDLLQQEGLIERVERKGTFVRTDHVRHPITVLLPCENYAELAGYSSIMSLQMLLNGAIKAAQQHGVRVETLAISPENRPEKIDWARLDDLNENSRLIVLGCWFQPVFDLLLERRCKVAHIAPRCSYTDEWYDRTAGWYRLHFNLEELWEQAARNLMEGGCRDIVFATNHVHSPLGAIKVGLERGIGHSVRGLELCSLNGYEQFCIKLRQFYEEQPFDGLLLNFTNFGHPALNRFGLPDSVKMALEMAIGVPPPTFAPYFCCPAGVMGERAVHCFLNAPENHEETIRLSWASPAKQPGFPLILT